MAALSYSSLSHTRSGGSWTPKEATQSSSIWGSANESNPKSGCWEKPIDTDWFFVIYTNVLRDCYGAVMAYRMLYPFLSNSARHVPRTISHPRPPRHLQTPHLCREQYGGMLSICPGTPYHFTHDIPTPAIRHTKWQACNFDLAWNRGFYYSPPPPQGPPPNTGMKLTRQLVPQRIRRGAEVW